MNTRLLKLSVLIVMIIPFYGCNETKELGVKDTDCEENLKYINEQLDDSFEFNENSQSGFDFCQSEESILLKSKYNTVTGIAHFTVPMPKGSNLKFIKKDKDTLYYECDGHGKVVYGNNDLIFENETYDNLPRIPQHKIWVEVKFVGFPVSDCKVVQTLQEKKKKSEVLGEPFVN